MTRFAALFLGAIVVAALPASAQTPPQLTPQGQILNPEGTGGAPPGGTQQEYSGVTGGGGVVMHGLSGAPTAEELANNDYPTVARADYVFACMQVNGQTRESLEKCSCSIDQIAAVMSYEKYEEAETIKSLQLRGGESVTAMSYPAMQHKVDDLKRAQVEAELRCF